ncbi:unnamed protein product [Amoebophrya sp. A25]|nr:unnamed protein product [Amoebophrya sp. A25]|eukprot:GSA25T00017457001.1
MAMAAPSRGSSGLQPGAAAPGGARPGGTPLLNQHLPPKVGQGALFIIFIVCALLFYNVTGLVVTLCYHTYPLIALSLVVLIMLFSLIPAFLPLVYPVPSFNGLYSFIERRLVPGTAARSVDEACIKKANRRVLQKIFSDLAACGFFFTCLGVLNYMYLYQHFGAVMMPDRTSYIGVDPRSTSQLWADGGTLEFIEGSRVDATRAVAYQPMGESATYCVAPVLFQSPTPVSRVEYWAVGVDCCKTANVFNCDDSAKHDARSGYIIPLLRYVDNIFLRAPPIRKWDRFQEAVKIAEKKYGFTTTEWATFLRWRRDPKSLEAELTNGRALTCLFQELAILLLALSIAGYCAIAKSPRLYGQYLEEAVALGPRPPPQAGNLRGGGPAGKQGIDATTRRGGIVLSHEWRSGPTSPGATQFIPPGGTMMPASTFGRPPNTDASLVSRSPGTGGRFARQSIQRG